MHLLVFRKKDLYLGDHPKAHIHEIRRISRNPVDFTWNPADFKWNLADFMWNLINSSASVKTLQFDECRVGAMTQDFMKSWVIAPPALHQTKDFLLKHLILWGFWWISWNPPDFERPIARNGNAYVFILWVAQNVSAFFKMCRLTDGGYNSNLRQQMGDSKLTNHIICASVHHVQSGVTLGDACDRVQ